MDISELQHKVDRLKRLHSIAKQLRANNEYDLKRDLEMAENKLMQEFKNI